MRLTVPERGSVKIKDAVWAAVSADPGFQDLVARDVLGARPDKVQRGWKLSAQGFVGQALLGGFEVEVVEKVPGAFQRMTEILAPHAFKLARAHSPIILGKPAHQVLAMMLLTATRTYLSGHKLTEYTTTPGVGAYVAGRLDLRRTIGFRSRGSRHKVAFQRTLLSDNLPLNRVIYRALGELSAGRSALAGGTETASAARALRASFSECATASAGMTAREILKEALIEAEIADRHVTVTETAALAAAVLQGATSSLDQAYQAAAPRSWFLNLENLFERVVRTCVANALAGIARVSGPIERPPLFPGPPRRFNANPDVVIHASCGTVLADAKYKDFNGSPSTADVYELLAHAAAYEAKLAALFYPSERDFSSIHIGRARTDCEVWAFSIPFSNFQDSVTKALDVIGLVASNKKDI